MATTAKRTGYAGPWIKSDEIFVDTSEAPWMTYAKAELGKKIHELGSDDAFVKSMREMLNLDERLRGIERQTEKLAEGSRLLDRAGSPWDADRYKLAGKTLTNPAHQLLGTLEAERMKVLNAPIGKYFEGVKTDPIYDKKGRSFELAPTFESGGYGRVTPWCAAFVNWCLGQAGAPRLGYATARSWLEFGTPIAHPSYGCLTIIKPSSATGSTTGHIGFFVEHRGNNVVLLGGNQGDQVSESPFRSANVLGYRWPTRIDHNRLASGGVIA